MTVSKIGPFAGTDNTGSGTPYPTFSSTVDYFFDTAHAITPEDAGPAPTTTTAPPTTTDHEAAGDDDEAAGHGWVVLG